MTVASAITYDGAGVPVALTQGGSLAQHIVNATPTGDLELTALGLPVTNLNLSLAKRYIRADESLSVTINIAPSQASVPSCCVVLIVKAPTYWHKAVLAQVASARP